MRRRWTVASVPLLFGLALLYLGAATAWATFQFQAYGASTRGEVTDRTFAGERKIVTVRFTTADGRLVFAAAEGRRLPDSGTVDVRYDRRDPQRIRIGDWQALYTQASVLGAAGAVVIAVSVRIVTAPRRRPDGRQRGASARADSSRSDPVGRTAMTGVSSPLST